MRNRYQTGQRNGTTKLVGSRRALACIELGLGGSERGSALDT
jgi:hypothetical protein